MQNESKGSSSVNENKLSEDLMEFSGPYGDGDINVNLLDEPDE